ncbi:MAG: MFS transporter [Bacteroidales bacterium]
MDPKSKIKLFRACFVALMATSFGFMLRAMLISEWGVEFNLTKTQMGEIMGVGLWPFALSIVLFSLIIDKIGNARAMIFAFICHVSSVVITLLANGYWMLYIGTFIFALGNGSIEAIINPVVATMYSKEKTKWLNILHAAWPGGMVVGGILALSMGEGMNWRFKMAIILLPMLVYGIMMLGKTFPINERVQAGVSYKDMLRELGVLGALIIISLMVMEVGNVFNFSTLLKIILIIVFTGSFGLYVRAWGQPLFFLLLLIMFPLATTELGTDSWVVDLMAFEMNEMGLQAGWILVYTSLIMTIFRAIAGPLLKVFRPIGLLMLCSAVASLGLIFLSVSAGILVFVAATIYGFAKSYFWPTMIGIVGERFPKGGALTLNVTTGVGMLAVGIIGAVFLGFVQDRQIEQNLTEYDKMYDIELTEKYISEEKQSVLGEYRSLDMEAVNKAPEEEKAILNDIQTIAKKDALKSVAILPAIMLVCFSLLAWYFRRRGGYKAISLTN